MLDFGLADRTAAVYDVAIALERFAVDWLVDPRRRPGARPAHSQLRRFLSAYRARRPEAARELAALPLLFPLCHAEYELSEIDYFLSVVPGGAEEKTAQQNAEIAYRDWFLGHAEWALGRAKSEAEEGQAFLGLLGEGAPL